MSAANDVMDRVIDLPILEEKTPPQKSSLGSALAWVIWVVSAAFVLVQFILQLSSGVVLESLMKDFSLSAFGGGVLASSYYYVYVALQAPAGFLVDRYGTRQILSVGAFVCGLGCILFAASHHVFEALLSRLLMGTGASFAFVGSMNLVARWFPAHRFGFMAAMAETLGMVGSLFGSFILAHLVLSVGWRVSMEGAASILLLIAVLLAVIVRNAPKNAVTPSAPRRGSELWRDVKSLIAMPVVWLNGFYGFAVFSIITVFVALWGIPFMQKMHHLSLSHATLLCNLVFIGVSIAAPLLGWLDMHVRSRKAILVGSAFLSSAILLLVIYDASLSINVVALLMLLLGVSSSSYVLNFVIANQVSNYYTCGTSIGLANMMCVASALVFQPLVGLILYLLSKHDIQTNFNAYTLQHFQTALVIVPIVVAAAGVIGFWLPNRRLA